MHVCDRQSDSVRPASPSSAGSPPHPQQRSSRKRPPLTAIYPIPAELLTQLRRFARRCGAWSLSVHGRHCCHYPRTWSHVPCRPQRCSLRQPRAQRQVHLNLKPHDSISTSVHLRSPPRIPCRSFTYTGNLTPVGLSVQLHDKVLGLHRSVDISPFMQGA